MSKSEDGKLDKLYFAYGINVSEDYIEERCGRENISTISGPAYLLDYELIYGGGEKAINRWSGTVSGVRKKIGSFVMGICYKVNDRALALLDEIENATDSHIPRLYMRRSLPVIVDGRKEDAFVYVASDYFLKNLDNRNISKGYNEIITNGFYQHITKYAEKLNEADALQYLKDRQKDAEQRGRFLRRVGKGLVLLPFFVYLFFTLAVKSTFFSNYLNAVSFFVVVITLLISAKAFINEGSAYGARSGKFEDMIFLMWYCSEKNCSPDVIVDAYLRLHRDPSIIRLLEKSGDVVGDTGKVIRKLGWS